MSTPHTRPEVYALELEGQVIAVVAAKTMGEARATITARRVGSMEAMRLGQTHPLRYANEDYALLDAEVDPAQTPLFPAGEGDDPERASAPHVQV
jgi:hypothetical protein